MSTVKSYIFRCASSLKLSTSDSDMAEIMDNMATLKIVRSFFPFNSKNISRNFLVGTVFLSLENITLVCRLGQANISHKIYSLLLRLVQTQASNANAYSSALLSILFNNIKFPGQ